MMSDDLPINMVIFHSYVLNHRLTGGSRLCCSLVLPCLDPTHVFNAYMSRSDCGKEAFELLFSYWFIQNLGNML